MINHKFYISLIILIATFNSIFAQLSVLPKGDVYMGFDSLELTGESIPYIFLDAQSASIHGGFNTIGAIDTQAQNSIIWGGDHLSEGSYNIIVGRVNSNYGGNFNIIGGVNNLQFGNNNTVWGNFNEINENTNFNTVGGQSNVILNDAEFNTVWGSLNTIDGNFNLVSGSENKVSVPGQFITMSGYQNIASGTNTTVMGTGNNGIFSNALILGTFNSNEDATYDDNNLIENIHDPLLIIGNGSDDSNRSNALVVTKNGRIGVGKSKPQAGIDIKEGTLILKEDILIEHISSTQLGINSSILPTQANQDLGGSILKWRNIYATNGVIQTSDISLKKDISPVTNVLDKVLQLEPIQYHMIDGDDGHLSTGLSAQAVEKQFPEVVSKSISSTPEGELIDTYGIRYTELIPILISAIQEQQVMIEELKSNQNK